MYVCVPGGKKVNFSKVLRTYQMHDPNEYDSSWEEHFYWDILLVKFLSRSAMTGFKKAVYADDRTIPAQLF